MPFEPEFIALIKLMGDLVGEPRQYLDWCLHFPNRFMYIEMNEVAKRIPGLIKGATFSMGSTPQTPVEDEPDPDIDEENAKSTSDVMKDFNSFVGEDLENIQVDMPEIEIKPKEKPTNDPTDNKLYKWLDGDIKNYESILMRCCEKSNPIRDFEKELNEKYSEMDCFPNITEKEMKSIIYLVGREHFLYNEQANNGAIKRSFTINKYNGQKHAKPINLEAAFDLLLLHIIIKICREKIENKTADNYTNKTLLHLASSMNITPFIFSFLSKETEMKSVLISKFREIKELGMMKSYEENEFKSYDFDITEHDIRGVIEGLEKYFDNDVSRIDTHMRHVTLFNNKSCLLNPDNQINEEQILNQVVPFEMHILMQNKSTETDRKELLAFAKERNYDDKVISMFLKITPKKNIPLVKFFEMNAGEVPEDQRQEFMDWIGEFQEKDYDLSDAKFPYDSFGEDAIKALYLWKPESGEKFITFKKFQKAIVSSTHDKNTILSMITHSKDDSKGETFADFYTKAQGRG
jgi:hypothetical protein